MLRAAYTLLAAGCWLLAAGCWRALAASQPWSVREQLSAVTAASSLAANGCRDDAALGTLAFLPPQCAAHGSGPDHLHVAVPARLCLEGIVACIDTWIPSAEFGRPPSPSGAAMASEPHGNASVGKRHGFLCGFVICDL